MDVYDLIIIGAGPAGLTAGIYATRYQLKNLVIGQVLGGTIATASKMCNYPGYEAIAGSKWAEIVSDQLIKLGGELILDTVKGIFKNEFFKVTASGGKEFFSQSLIVATGSERKELGIPGEKEYLGHGVSYCATCDAPFFKEKTVAVIGGADAAVSSALHLSNFAKKVYLIYRREKLRAEAMWVEQALKNPKTEAIYNTNLTEIKGEKGETGIAKVIGVELDNPYKDSNFLVVDGVFIEIGGVPTTALTQSLGVELDEEGFIKVNEEKETNIPGVFAAGDVTSTGKKFQQVVFACAQGAQAAASAFRYLRGEKAPQIKGV